MNRNETAQSQVNHELAALVERAQAGDQSAFTELFDRTAPDLYRCIRAMTRNEDLAWDIQQDSYLRAYSKLDQLDNAASFFPWLRRIAVNLTVRRMSQRLPMTFTDLAGEEDEAIPELPDLNMDNQPELSLDRKETARLLQEILSKLPEEQQLIIGMRYYDELSVKEIASLLNVSTGTVKTQLYHGRKKVENAVRALEKQGLKLYGLSPLPFLLSLMRRAEPAQTAKAMAVKTAVAASAANSVGAQAVSLTAMTFRQLLHSSIAKILVGTLSVAAIGGGIWAGSQLLKSDRPIMPYQPKAKMEAVSFAHNILKDTSTDSLSQPESTTFQPDPDWPSGSCGENLRWYFDPDAGRLTIEGSGALEDYGTIMHDGDWENYPAPWDDYRDVITAVSLPNGLTHIGSRAFYYCSSLTSVTIPDGVIEIAREAFAGCSSLTGISIPDSVEIITYGAFSNCFSLTNISIPDSVTDIGVVAFQDCKNLSNVIIGTGVECIGSSAFYNCTSLTSVIIPDGVKTIMADAFNGCRALTEVSIPGSVTEIGEHAFGYYNFIEGTSVLDEKEAGGFTIHGVTGSAAERYAEENGFSFVAEVTEISNATESPFQNESEMTTVSLTLPYMKTEDYFSYQSELGEPSGKLSLEIPAAWSMNNGTFSRSVEGSAVKALEPVCMLRAMDDAQWEKLVHFEAPEHSGELEYLSVVPGVDANGRTYVKLMEKIWNEDFLCYPCEFFLRDTNGIVVHMTYYLLNQEDPSANTELQRIIDSIRVEPTEPAKLSSDPDRPSGSHGENLRWYFDPDAGRLTIDATESPFQNESEMTTVSLTLPYMKTEDYFSYQSELGEPSGKLSLEIPAAWSMNNGTFSRSVEGSAVKALEPVCMLRAMDDAQWEKLVHFEAPEHSGELEYLSVVPGVDANGRTYVKLMEKIWNEDFLCYPCEFFLRDTNGIVVHMTYYLLNQEDPSANTELQRIIDSIRVEPTEPA